MSRYRPPVIKRKEIRGIRLRELEQFMREQLGQTVEGAPGVTRVAEGPIVGG
jgi:hypothetical protein